MNAIITADDPIRFCKDCRYFTATVTNEGRCSSPEIPLEFDLVSGAVVPIYSACSVLRSNDGAAFCGRSARFFVAKEAAP